jgi:oligosaccharide repeat unit polymerase
MLKNRQTFVFILLWYILPILVLFYNEIYVFNSLIILFVFLISYSFSFFIFKKAHFNVIKTLKLNFNIIHKILLIITLLISIFYLSKIPGEDLSNLRMDFYEAKGIFSNTILTTLYGSILMPFIIISITALSFNFNKFKKYVLLGLLILIFDAILRQGRFQLLFILFFLFYFRDIYKIKLKYILLTVFLAIVFSFYTLYTRFFINDAAITDLSDFLVPKVIFNSSLNYQLYGYVFLDNLVENLSPIGKFYEFNLFNQFFYLINTIFLTKVGLFIHYPWEAYNLILDQGVYSKHFDFDFNAFSTNFYPIFLDYGFFGIFFYGFFSGYFTAINSENKFIKTIKTLNIFVLVFGLYQPIIIYLVGFIYLISGLYIFFSHFIKAFKFAKL